MNIKKIICCIIAAGALATCIGCSSGGLTGVHNPVPSKAQTVSKQATSSDTEKVVDYAGIARSWLEAEDTWSHAKDMPSSGIAGIYSTGYYIFDIDLDGEKELLVQLGGDHTQSCKTIIYKRDKSGEIKQLNTVEVLNLSVQNLELWSNDKNESFYINEHVLIGEGDVFVTSWSKLKIVDGVLTEEPAFYMHMTYDKLTGNMDTMQFLAADGKTVLTDDEYNSQIEAYYEGYTEVFTEPDLIKSSSWQYYVHNQKLNAIIDGLKN